MSENDEVWGPVDIGRWRSIPHLRGRSAAEDDIRLGCAAFSVAEGAEPEPISLPACAIVRDHESGDEVPVIVIQAERVGTQVILGFRFLDGGNGVCTLPEMEFLEGPDSRFT